MDYPGVAHWCCMQTRAHSLCGRNEMNGTDQSTAQPTAKYKTSERLLRTRWRIPFAGFLLGLMGGLSYTWGVYIGPLVERLAGRRRCRRSHTPRSWSSL